MKLLIEKLPLSDNTSFVARTYKTPYFEVPWHQHIECELILFTEGKGTAFVGNYIGEFEPGDIYFLGADVPHTFQPVKGTITSAVVVQFREDFWGKEFLAIPENKTLRNLFEIAARGLKLKGKCKLQLNALIKELESAAGLQRIITLCNCLQAIASSQEYDLVSTQEIKQLNAKHKERIDAVFQYTIENFQEPVQLPEVAQTAGLSVPAFCNYFKKSTKKTYIDFLNEIRIGHACKLLNDTQKTVMDICYESGFNTLANFNKQFLKQKRTTPSGYRKALHTAGISKNRV
ncbi:MAG: helix-turn-helix domain-containing protein [Bacteroidetes bacterium]|nr:helix-turn-helix domain-containing protein [Bacteroidota bacterium]MBS1609827.1 helix-turn-helix domain-containing protein [Bacteroidota bacterium]